MRICIIDDDKNQAQQLANLLEGQEDANLVNVSHTGLKGLAMVGELTPDVVFLDVEMPDSSGLDLLSEMPQGTLVVMFTAHGKYMLDALRGRAFDFLHKPVVPEEFEKVMSRLREELAKPSQNERKQPRDEEHFISHTTIEDFCVLRLRDIGAFVFNREARSWEAIVADRPRPVRLRRAMKASNILSWSDSFVQVHQSYIVNITYLAEVAGNVCHLLPPFDHIEYIHMGRSYRSKFMERYKNL